MNREREQELATLVQLRKRTLLGLLTPQERKTVRRHGSAESETFEDRAREIAEAAGQGRFGRPDAVKQALDEYVEVINLFWTYVQENRMDDVLSSTWLQKHRGYRYLDRDELAAEALFAMRAHIVTFMPNNGNFIPYSQRGVHQCLTEWAAQQGPVEIPRDESRKTGPSVYRRSLTISSGDLDRRHPEIAMDERSDSLEGKYNADLASEDLQLSYDPTDALNAYLDGDVDPEDL